MEVIKRNEMIAGSIERELSPVLPFELILAADAMDGHVKRQALLGEAMGEAMSQSSETWHDNATAEAITSDSLVLEALAKRTMGIISSNEVYSYPEAEYDEVTLGSIVDVTYGGSGDIERIVLTGVSREVPTELMMSVGIEDEVDVITLASPVGVAILGKKVGDMVDYSSPTGRELSLRIIAIQQLSV